MSRTVFLQRRSGRNNIGIWDYFDATGIGIGVIVGGGILALVGTAFAATGPGAWLVFLLNGIIAIITALSFAELSTAFPMSDGTYLFPSEYYLLEQYLVWYGWCGLRQLWPPLSMCLVLRLSC